MKRVFLLILFVYGTSNFCLSQKQNYKVAIIGFYNLENFFDTINNPAINDEEFLPSGEKNYNSKIYFDKIEHLATVISQIGTEYNADGPAILGVAEVENDTVLNDLSHHSLLQSRHYKWVHYNSKDARGIDVAMLYNPKYFKVDTSAALFVNLPSGSKDAYYTRDVLWVKGKLGNETIHVFVNHWPSRVGGEARSRPARIAAATVDKKKIDSILQTDQNAKIVVMGDLNDDPVNVSVSQVLNARENKNNLPPNALYNPWISYYKNGIGTLAYRDAWNLFDQIMLSPAWLNQQQDGFFFYKALIFRKEFMVENNGKYKGYPMRTWDGNTYRGGYSDHFPTYVVLLKKIKE